MDSAADGLLALSNTAAAIAENQDLEEDDDRSSSLSELDDAPENIDIEEEDEEEDEDESTPRAALADGDSEAETERLDESPDKLKRPFQISPSKLAQSMNMTDERPEIEELTNSDVSSPITPVEDSPLQSELSEAEDVPNPLDILSQAATTTTNKRKRLSDVIDMMDDQRPRKRRTQSIDSEDEKSDAESELPELPSREPTLEPDDVEAQPESEKEDDQEEEAGPETEQLDLSDSSKGKKLEQYTRSRSRRGKDDVELEAQDEEENEAAEASEEDLEGDDVDDTTTKNEEEQQTRAAAMEALTALERHFATLRDKLYDEKIAQLNHELDQLVETESTHPELLKQFECVNKYRDEKQDTEQKLLVFKVAALKRKSVAERSQLHSAYFQSVRDIRERHMERMSEHFYRIQRERFKSSQVTPIYTIPFPDRRAQQVTQQTAYNKEVSILSGIGKYVGFPAAPELLAAQTSDLEGDMQKMGINPNSIRSHIRNAHRTLNSTFPTTSSLSSTSAAAAGLNTTSEQQFLEQTPWANPNHPIHRLGRQTARSPLPETSGANSTSYSTNTPANQQKRTDYTPQPIGSASTIVENPSAPPSSAINTPHDSAVKQEPLANGLPTTNGTGDSTISRQNTLSPTDTRRPVGGFGSINAGFDHEASSVPPSVPVASTSVDGAGIFAGVNSSPLQARASLLTGLNRTASVQPADHENTRSPFRQGLGNAVGAGMGRFGFR